jgi:hypothetical protein
MKNPLPESKFLAIITAFIGLAAFGASVYDSMSHLFIVGDPMYFYLGIFGWLLLIMSTLIARYYIFATVLTILAAIPLAQSLVALLSQ